MIYSGLPYGYSYPYDYSDPSIYRYNYDYNYDYPEPIRNDLADLYAPVPHGASDRLLRDGLQSLKNRDYKQASNTLVQAVLADPQAGLPKLIFANALFALGDYDYAAYAVRRGLARVNDVASAVQRQKSYFKDAAELDRLIYRLHDVVQHNKGKEDAVFLLGYYHYVAGQMNEAEQYLAQAGKRAATDRWAARLHKLVQPPTPLQP